MGAENIVAQYQTPVSEMAQKYYPSCPTWPSSGLFERDDQKSTTGGAKGVC